MFWTWSHTVQHSCIIWSMLYWAQNYPPLVMAMLLHTVQLCQLISVMSCPASYVPSLISIVWPNCPPLERLDVEMLLSSSYDLIRIPFSHSWTGPSSGTNLSSAHQQREEFDWQFFSYTSVRRCTHTEAYIVCEHTVHCTHTHKMYTSELIWLHTPKCSNSYMSIHIRDILRTEFISIVIRPPELISWLSTSSYTLSSCGRHRFVIALTAPLKKGRWLHSVPFP